MIWLRAQAGLLFLRLTPDSLSQEPLCGSQSAQPCVSTEKTGRVTGRREAEPPEVAQITETVVPLVPWK